MTIQADTEVDPERAANLKISAEVRAWMARLELRQSWLGGVLDLSQSVVSKRLRGLLPFTGPELLKIASSMDISLGELLGGIVNEKNPHPVDGGSSNGSGRGTRSPDLTIMSRAL